MGEFMAFVGQCFAPANFVYTLLLILLVLYWLGVVAGGIDVEAGTPDLDFSPDAGADVDVDAHADLDGHGTPAWISFLRFFNIGEVPLMVYLSVFIPCAWLLSLTAADWLGWTGSWLALPLLCVPIGLVSALAAKFVCAPMKALFRGMNREVGLVNKLALVGREGVVVSLEVSEHSGQVEVPAKGAPLTINARSRAGETLRKGDRASIVAEIDEDKAIYRVEKC